LRDHPEINVNWQDTSQWTPLHIASNNGHDEVVKLLLAHPDIDVNMKNKYGDTPLHVGCEWSKVPAVQSLLKDPRVDITLDDEDGCTPLWWASYYGNWYLIEWLIASGRDLGDLNKKGTDWGDDKDYTALEIAKERNMTEVVSAGKLHRQRNTDSP